MTISPPRNLYDRHYYETSCEGFENSIEVLGPRLRHFETWIAPRIGGVVLDIGFGRGELSIRAARLPNVVGVISIDYSYDAVVMFMERLKHEPAEIQGKIIQICDDIENILQYLNLTLSHVIAFDVIEHIYPDQVTRLFSHLYDRMGSGGKVYVVTPLSNEVLNERHVWLARTPDDLFKLIPVSFDCTHVGPSGSGEDHLFEITKR